MAELENLEEKQSFWKALFEEKKLAPQLCTLATVHDKDGVSFELQQYGKIHVLVRPASALGVNFSSDTFFVKARLQREDVSHISDNSQTLTTFVKILPSNVWLRQGAYESRVHHKEINAYTHLFDSLRKLSAQHSAVPLDVPDVYYAHLEEIVKDETDGSGTCILLENLDVEGYSMSDIRTGADYNHCRISLTSLAHYHALTHVLLKSWIDPSTGECSKAPPEAQFIFEKTLHDTKMIDIIRDWCTALMEFIKNVNIPGLNEWLADLVGRLSEVVIIDTLENSGPLACILHGDFWNNNVLFKYASTDLEGEKQPDNTETCKSPVPIGLKLVDFQVVRIGHPITDILFYMYTSATPEIREQHMNDLLQHYFDTLTSDLKLFGVTFDNYTLDDFLKDYKKRSLTSMFKGAMMMYMALSKSIVKELEEKSEAKTEEDDQDFEKKLKNMMENHQPSMDENTSLRILKLILEVKTLTSSSPNETV